MKQKKIKVFKNYKFSYIHTHNEILSNNLVIMLHGFCMDKDEKGNYVKLADILLDNGYDSIRLDFLGHGESNGDSIELTIDLCLKEIELIVSGYNYKNISIIGSSFGGGSSSFGGGMGRLREVCGAVSGMFMVADILYGYDNPTDHEA